MQSTLGVAPTETLPLRRWSGTLAHAVASGAERQSPMPAEQRPAARPHCRATARLREHCLRTRLDNEPGLWAPLTANGAISGAGMDESGVRGPAWPVLSVSNHARRPFRPPDRCRFGTGAGTPQIGMSLVLGDSSSASLVALSTIGAALGARSAPGADYCFDQRVSQESASA
jgi:hypothetical protein